MKILSMAIIFVVTTAVMKYLYSSSYKNPINNKDGSITLKMSKAYGLIGFIGLIFTGLIGILASLGTVMDIGDLVAVVFLVALFLGLSSLLVLVFRNMNIKISDEEIEYSNLFRKTTKISWAEITDVSFSKVSLEMKLKTESKVIKIHAHLVGFKEFIRRLKEKLNPELYMDALLTVETMDKKMR